MVFFDPNLNSKSSINSYRGKPTGLKAKEHDPDIGRNKIYGKASTMVQPIDPDIYHQITLSNIGEMLNILESQKYISDKYIYQEYRKDETVPRRFTTKEILLELLDQTLMNSIEATCKRWKASDYVGSRVSVIAFTEQDKLWVRIIDNGSSFPENVLPKIGNESLSSRDTRMPDEFYFNDALKDHLFKTGQLALILDWKLVAENNRFTGGASVSIVLPLTNNDKI